MTPLELQRPNFHLTIVDNLISCYWMLALDVDPVQLHCPVYTSSWVTQRWFELLMQYVHTPCVWLAWCGGCLCGPGLVKPRALMDVNRLAFSYCVNINHQAWTPPPHVALLNIHNTLHTSQPQISAHTYTLTCTYSQSFLSHLSFFSSTLLPVTGLFLSLLSFLSPLYFLFISQSFIFDFTWHSLVSPFTLPWSVPPFHLQ